MTIRPDRTKRKFDEAVQLLHRRVERHNRNVDAVVRSHALVQEGERKVERLRKILEKKAKPEAKPEAKAGLSPAVQAAVDRLAKQRAKRIVHDGTRQPDSYGIVDSAGKELSRHKTIHAARAAAKREAKAAD